MLNDRCSVGVQPVSHDTRLQAFTDVCLERCRNATCEPLRSVSVIAVNVWLASMQ